MCYCGILSFIGLIEFVASILILISVYIEYSTCYVSNIVYSLVWIQCISSAVLYVLHCIPGLYMMLKAMKIKVLAFILQMILCIITFVMIDFNEVSQLSCQDYVYNTMTYASAVAMITAIISAIYVIYKEPKTNNTANNNNTEDI